MACHVHDPSGTVTSPNQRTGKRSLRLARVHLEHSAVRERPSNNAECELLEDAYHGSRAPTERTLRVLVSARETQMLHPGTHVRGVVHTRFPPRKRGTKG